jgi:hypothetical protein
MQRLGGFEQKIMASGIFASFESNDTVRSSLRARESVGFRSIRMRSHERRSTSASSKADSFAIRVRQPLLSNERSDCLSGERQHIPFDDGPG